jgi:hypothetical protein
MYVPRYHAMMSLPLQDASNATQTCTPMTITEEQKMQHQKRKHTQKEKECARNLLAALKAKNTQKRAHYSHYWIQSSYEFTGGRSVHSSAKK